MIDFSTFLKDKDNFRFQLISSYIILSILLLSLTVLLQVYLSSLQDKVTFQQNIKVTAEKRVNALSQYLNHKKNEIRTIAVSPLALSAIENKDDTYLNQYFYDKAIANTDYAQISYIDKHGTKIISINRNKYGDKPYSIKANFSKDKVMQRQIMQIMNTKYLDVWLSELGEPKKIVHNELIHIEPILKMGTVVQNTQKEVQGIILIEFFIRDYIVDLFSEEVYDTYFIDNQGYYLVHPNYQKNWSKYYSHRTLKDDFSAQLSQIIESSNPLYLAEEHIYTVPFNINNNKYTMIFTQKKSELTKKRENGLTILYVILTVVFISAFLFANLFSKPFDSAYKKLCNEAEKLHHSTIVLQQRIIDEVEKNKRQELILQHQSKLSALGELLSAITHQWRHPITRISLLLQNLRINLKMNKKLDDETDTIILSGYEQIDFLSETIENFKNFYKFDDKKELFNLREALTSVINIMCDIFDFHTIKLHIELDDTLKIYGNKVAFSHVFLNIMNNSKDEIVQRKIKNPRIHIVSKVRSNHIAIFIYDNAGGVIGTSVNKIFDPYISTKAKEGSGMGLYIARAIVEEKFKGTIVARNIENGLLFKINLEQYKV